MYYKDLLRFRQAWLGVALLWIVLFHLPLDLGLLTYPAEIGYGGVDICFFASGIGCFYSLSKEPGIEEFIKRRLKRLAPTYIVFIIVWLVCQYILGNFSIQMALGNLFAVQNFTGLGYDFNWYISAIFLAYILAPYFMLIAKQASYANKVLFLLFLIAFSIPFWRANTYIITVTRFPIFYLGMVFADMCMKEKQISRTHLVCLIVSFVLGAVSLMAAFSFFSEHLWSHGLYWYPFILITPPLCIAISYVSMLLEKTKATKLLVSFLSLCGNYSFELYLVHILLISCISILINALDLSQISNLLWAASSILLIVGCYILRRFTTLICEFLHRNRSSNS